MIRMGSKIIRGIRMLIRIIRIAINKLFHQINYFNHPLYNMKVNKIQLLNCFHFD